MWYDKTTHPKLKMNLLCKDISVAELSLVDNHLVIEKIIEPAYLPIMVKTGAELQQTFDDWLAYRNIPKSRNNLQKILGAFRVSSIAELSLRNLGLSLSDSYWIKPQESSLSWNDVNLYENSFYTINEQILENMPLIYLKRYNPDSSSNGELRKFWSIKDNIRVLYKESRKPYFQQAYNEVFADKLLTQLGLPHVSYSIEIINDKPFSVCPAFTSPEIEYVPAWYILGAVKKKNDENTYQHFQRCVEKLKIPYDTKLLHNMLAFDYLIYNQDRHFGNFGFLRNVDTLEFVGMAPIFDNGTSMWFDTLDADISTSDMKAKPFKDSFKKQLEMLPSYFDAFNNLKEDIVLNLLHETYQENERFTEKRFTRLANALKKTLNFIQDRNMKKQSNERMI